MEQTLSPLGGLLVLLAFAIVVNLIAWFVARGRRKDIEEFLVADRQMGVLPTSLSIAASWIWAPALFVAAQKAYEQGCAGLFWYCVPNFLSLVVFGLMALKLRQRIPKGYTFPQLVRERHGRGVHMLYLIQFFGLQLGCFAVQLLAGASMMKAVSGIDFGFASVILTIVVLCYATVGGMRASIATDFVQMLMILTVLAVTIPWTVFYAGGIERIQQGIGGLSGEFSNAWNPWVAYSFGLPVTISLMSGPIGDQMHWQRGFVVSKDKNVLKSYLIGSFVFILVPLSLGLLGFIAAADARQGTMTVTDPQMVGPSVVSNYLPKAMMVLYVIMVLSGLCSTLDSVLCAVSSLVAVDLVKNKLDDGERYRWAKTSMIILAILSLLIANIPGLKILHLFIIYGSWRASTMVPTYLMLLWDGVAIEQRKLNSRCVFVSILLCLVLAWPVLATGSLTNNPHLTVIGSLSIVTLSLLVCVGGSLYIKANKTQTHTTS